MKQIRGSDESDGQSVLLVVCIGLILGVGLAGCVEPEQDWAGIEDFGTLRIHLDNKTVVSEIDMPEEVQLRQLVWDFLEAGDLDGVRAGQYNLIRSGMQQYPYVAINSTDLVSLKGEDGQPVVVYFILVSLDPPTGRPDGIVCDASDCTRIGSALTIDNLTKAASDYMATHA